MDFIHKMLQNFIALCKEFGLSEKDIKEGFDKASKIFKTIDFEDKDHADQIGKALDEEKNKLNSKK